jgi:hypothetical protein
MRPENGHRFLSPAGLATMHVGQPQPQVAARSPPGSYATKHEVIWAHGADRSIFFSKKRQAFMLHYWLIVFAANLLGTAGRCLNSELLYLLPCLCHHLYLSRIITATHFITPSCPVSYP